jgi:magnesium-transporting ATPase (P-type)
VLAGSFSALAALAVIQLRGGDPDHARWLAYSVLVIGQVVRVNANRSLTLSVLRLRPNGFLALASLVAAAIQVAIPFVPPLADAFRASLLAPWEWALVAVLALAPAFLADGVRRMRWTWVA